MQRALLLAFALASLTARAEQPVAVTGGSGAAHAWVNSPSPFWIRVQNNSGTAIQNLAMDMVGDAFGPICWKKTTGSTGGCGTAATELKAGEILFLNGTIKPLVSGDWRPQLVLSWGTPPASNVTAVALGTLKVENYSWSWVQWVTDSLKNLALPLVVAGIGIYYQYRQKRSETERLAREKSLEVERLDREKSLETDRFAAEKKRVERAETLRIMLPKSHDYATKYYAALEMRSNQLGKAMTRYNRQPTDAGLDELTFWVVSLYHAHRLLLGEVGAYYFKDRMGEELAVGAFGVLNESIFEGHDGVSFALTQVLDLLGARMMLPQGTFLKTLSEASTKDQTRLADVRGRMQEWMASGSWNDASQALSVYSRVLSFEMNRPYENWYETEECLDLDDQQIAAVARIVTRIRPQYGKGILAYVETYRRKAT